jgi:hypothetical protein
MVLGSDIVTLLLINAYILYREREEKTRPFPYYTLNANFPAMGIDNLAAYV